MDQTEIAAEDDGPPELQATLWTCNNPQSSVAISQHSVTFLAFGTHHCIFLTKQGQVYSFGKNNFGQLGSGDTTEYARVPFHVSEISSQVNSIACGPEHSAALTVDGKVYMWGKNDCGQCGHSADILHSPQVIEIQEVCGKCQDCGTTVCKPAVVTAVSCGASHTLAVTKKHEVFSWGSGPQLGLGFSQRTLPQRIDFLHGRKVISVTCGDTYSLAVTDSTQDYDFNDPAVACGQCASSASICPLGLPCVGTRSPDLSAGNVNGVADTSELSQVMHGEMVSERHSVTQNEKQSADGPKNGLLAYSDSTKDEAASLAESNAISHIANGVEDEGIKSKGQNGEQFHTEETNGKAVPDERSKSEGDVELRRPRPTDCAKSPSFPGKRTSSLLDDPELAMEFLDRQLGHKPRDQLQKSVSVECSSNHSRASMISTSSSSAVRNVLWRVTSTVSDRISFVSLNPRLSQASHSGSAESFEFLEVDRSSGSHSERTDERKGSRGLSPLVKRESSLRADQNGKQSSNSGLEFQVWSWGKGTHGQLGHGDELDRGQPCLMKHLNESGVIKVSAGHGHSLALTSRCTVLSWGQNDVGQLGHSQAARCISTPKVVTMPRNEPVSDIAAGRSHSLFLVDSGGSKAAMYSCGQHECVGSSPCICQKMKKIYLIMALKKIGLVTNVFAGGCYSGCVVDNKDSDQMQTLYEFAVTERRCLGHLCTIQAKLHHHLVKKGNIVSDVPEYSCDPLKAVIGITVKLISMMSLNAYDLTRLLQSHGSGDTLNIVENSSEWIDVFCDYVKALSSFLAVGGFATLSKMFAFSPNALNPIAKEIIGDVSAKNSQGILLQLFSLPVKRIGEYSRLLTRLLSSLNLSPQAAFFQELQACSNDWVILADVSAKEMSLAEATKAFWESVPQKIVDMYRVPQCRMLRDSKTHPLQLLSTGRFASHHFILFNDKFTHYHFGGFQNYSLQTVWVEADTEAETTFAITTPEDTLVFSCPCSSEKTEWVCSLNQAIRNLLNNVREKSLLKNLKKTDNRLTPPMARHSSYTFTKSLMYKDATYSGSWLKGMLHGHGELTWPDGRKYTGKFKNNLQHGEGEYVVPGAGGDVIFRGTWKNGKLHGLGSARYPNGDCYEGFFKDGQRDGHGVLKEGKYLSSSSIYIGQWCQNKRHGYGVLDNEREGEKYMGMWQDDVRHGKGIMVTLDDVYYEGDFVNNILSGSGTMMFQDNTVFKGELGAGGTLNGKGTLALSNGDRIEGTFYGMWSEGIRISGVYHKAVEGENGACDIDAFKHTGESSHQTVPASEKWKDIFDHCRDMLGIQGVSEAQDNKQAWDAVAVAIHNEKKKKTKHRSRCCQDDSLDYLERIPRASKKQNTLTLEQYNEIKEYLQRAFDCVHHPLAYVLEGLVGVFRLTYCGIGVHPRLLVHAVAEVKSFCSRLYELVRTLFPDLPPEDKPVVLRSDENAEPLDDDLDVNGECVTPNTLIQPFLLPRLYPSLSTLYALNNEKEDKHYWERLMKWNKQSDLSLMTFLGVDQKFINLKFRAGIFNTESQRLSSIKDECFKDAIEALQHISTAFTAFDKLLAIRQTFEEINKEVQEGLGDFLWSMDDLFPVFQYVVVRARIRNLGSEIHFIDDLMEHHFQNGELGIMFTTVKACHFQIQTEKLIQSL